MTPTVYAVGGRPFSGKTSLASRLARRLGIQHTDIDWGPAHCVLPAVENPYSTDEKAAFERARMIVAYWTLHASVTAHVHVGRSVVISATYTRAEPRSALLKAIGHANLKFFWCRIDDTPEEIERRLKSRLENDWIGGCRSVEQYQKLRPQYSDPGFSHHVINTMHGEEVALRDALQYLGMK